MAAGERTRYYQVRPRRVPPEFCTDELLEECSVLATLLLYRLISQADDQGRQPGHPKSVRATCFPMRPEISARKVTTLIDELVRSGFVIRYDVAGRTFLQIDRWFDLQGKSGQRRYYPSRYPAPPAWEDHISPGLEDEDEVRALRGQPVGNVPPPVSPPFSVSSSVPVPGLGEEAARGRQPERIGDVLERARRGRMSESDAFELGSVLARDEQARERTPR